MKRCGIGDPIHEELRRIVCVPTRRYLWVPADEITFVPGLLDTIYGDGRALWHLATINQRPAFYVIRGDSGWIESNHDFSPTVHFGELTDIFYNDLEAQFGIAKLDSEEDDPERLAEGMNPWPAFDDEGGCGWGAVSWPKQFARKLEPSGINGWRHPMILRREYAFEDQYARLADDGGPVVERDWF